MNLTHQRKRLAELIQALAVHQVLRRRERWSRAELVSYQRQRLERLIAHATTHSAFYREAYAGRRFGPSTSLESLPVLTKSVMMQSYDRLVTDPRLTLTQIGRHLAEITSDQRYLGEYRILCTAGTTGQKGFFAYSRREWSIAMASMLRCASLFEFSPKLTRRVRLSQVAAGDPVHATYRLAASLDMGAYRIQVLPVTKPLAEIVRALNEFQPEVLSSYPTMAALLAVEQVEGRLRIAPKLVMTTAEMRTPEMQRRIVEAWGIKPFDLYGTSELPIFGAECRYHKGMHAFEDLFVLEVTDDDYRPVRDGEVGSRVLLTNLYNYTQPLIRMEVSDMLRLATEPCPCGRPFRVVASMEGRNAEILRFRGADGRSIAVHPLQLHTPLAKVPELREYRIAQNTNGLRIEVALRLDARPEAVVAQVATELDAALRSHGVLDPSIRVDVVPELARDGAHMGKLKLIQSNASE